jgi:hypothetical protein
MLDARAKARAYHRSKSEKQIPFGNDNKKCNCSNKCWGYVVTAPSLALLTEFAYLAKTPRL